VRRKPCRLCRYTRKR